jgi:Ca2+-binding EF-hand superfamily protein
MIEAFQDLIHLEKDLERIKIEITLKDDYNLIDAFGLLDFQGKGFVSPVELREALQEMGIKCNIDEINMVFERFNTLNDGMLKYSEFSESMMPQD